MANQDKSVSAAKTKKPSIIDRAKKWALELRGEVKKIVWPSKEQTRDNTVIVLACCLVLGAFIWIVDALFSLGVQSFIGLF